MTQLCGQTHDQHCFVLSLFLPALQVQFIDYVAGPLWERLGQVCVWCVCMGRPRERGWLGANARFVSVSHVGRRGVGQDATVTEEWCGMLPAVHMCAVGADNVLCCQGATHVLLCVLLCVVLEQIFPTLQEPLQNLRTNRSKFAALAQSSLGEASVGACPREPSAPSTGISSRSSFSDMASCAEAVTAAQPPAPDQQQQ